MEPSIAVVVDDVRRAIGADGMLAVALAPGVGVGLAVDGGSWDVAAGAADPVEVIRRVEEELGPRWVWWSIETARMLVTAAVRIARCWDVATAQRLLAGGWRTDPARVWAQLHDLPGGDLPTVAPHDLFSSIDPLDLSEPTRPDGHLHPEWVDAWSATPGRLRVWAGLALDAQRLQERRLTALDARPAAMATARSESAAELLCAELAHDGLPMDRAVAERIIGDLVGPRATSAAAVATQRARRDAGVLRHAPGGIDADLRNPAQVRSLLRTISVDLPDTRAWRLEELQGTHPLVDALLLWRKAERVSTTYGYGWLDEHLGGDGRLRGEWSGCDGGAGRMTATAGLHNMPAHMRAAVVAEAGHRFVRADLGQIEPRVLAAVSGDATLARATREDDMYTPVAAQLAVDRPTAKVAVLGAMYGQTTGQGAHALRRLQTSYPVAMAFLEAADHAGQAGRDLRTHGGRLILMGSTSTSGMTERDARSRAAARGRFARNAVVQGAAAEFFKVWAATMRARCQRLGAHIVLCLHDELLVHAPAERAEETGLLLAECLDEAAARWSPAADVRFVAEISVIDRWSQAKP